MGKVRGWDAWMEFPDKDALNDVFFRLSSPVQELKDDDFALLQWFVVFMFSRSCAFKKVNEARQHLFAHRSIECIPPSEAALLQQALRAVFQAGHIWGLGTRVPSPILPSARKWGWLGDGSDENPYVPNWTLLPQASKVCKEYPHCKCRKGCIRSCPCFGNTLCCTKV